MSEISSSCSVICWLAGVSKCAPKPSMAAKAPLASENDRLAVPSIGMAFLERCGFSFGCGMMVDSHTFRPRMNYIGTNARQPVNQEVVCAYSLLLPPRFQSLSHAASVDNARYFSSLRVREKPFHLAAENGWGRTCHFHVRLLLIRIKARRAKLYCFRHLGSAEGKIDEQAGMQTGWLQIRL